MVNPKKNRWLHTKQFGKHVIGFYGSTNGAEQKPMISISPDEDLNDPFHGHWISLAEATRLQNALYKAIVHMRQHYERSKAYDS